MKAWSLGWVYVALCGLALSTAVAGNPPSAGALPPYTGGTDMNQAGNATSAAVQGVFGSANSMNNGLAQPLSSASPMTTVDGSQTFGAQVGCPASSQYLQVTMLPQASGDLSQIAVDWDPKFTGTYTTHLLFGGPFAGICNNGVIHCDAGTFNNCTYSQWTATATSIGLMAVPQDALGACYCINNDCGTHLALSNSQKVLSDIGGGIALALNAVQPRLTLAPSTFTDPTQEVFYGNQAGCGTDSQPEQYVNNVGALQTQGAAVASDPTSEYAMTMNAGVTAGDGGVQNSCSINRIYDLDQVDKNQVIQVLSRTAGVTSDCGAGCVQLELGRVAPNYWNGGGCTVFGDQEQIQVNGGAFVTSATLTRVQADDWAQVLVNSSLVYAYPSTWTSTTQSVSPGGSCETNRLFTALPNLDLTRYFQANGVVNVQNRISVGGTGDGWSYLQIQVADGCRIQDTYVSDACSGFEANPKCTLESETVDGVQTVVNSQATGLQPLPSQEDVKSSACDYGLVTNPFWSKQRVYVCQNGTQSTYDDQDAVERFNEVSTTLNPSNGNYTDRTVTTAEGAPTFTASNVPLPPAAAKSCAPVCETMAPGMGESVGDQVGATNALNTGGNPAQYSYKQCTAMAGAGVTCPLDPGETILSPCGCQSTFGQAASVMQTIRASSQDVICTQQ